MKGLIVDDEARSRRILKALCEEYCTGLEIVDMADSVSQARLLIKKHKPDLVFLDIEMPVESGFALLENKEEHDFEIILTTAYDQYAYEAFKHSALDYLLKPIEIDELIGAVEKSRARLNNSSSESEERIVQLIKILKNIDINKIALITMDGYTFIESDRIVRCEADSGYSKLYFDDGNSLLITKNLGHFEDILSPKGFFRVHRSHLINLKYVRKFIRGKKGILEMIDGQKIEVSTRKRDSLLETLALKPV